MPETDPPAPAVEIPKEDSSWRISPVWLVPLAALVIALAVAWRTYSERGPLIEIVFDNAAGVEAGQTTVRFRDVNVGTVERIDLTPDLKQVVVTARIRKDVARYLDEDAAFWVVRPSVTAQGVSGIETVLSGVYIAAFWDEDIGPRVEHFQGLPRPPLTPADQPGLRVRLRAPDGGSVTIGAPVLFKRIQVGRIEDIQLTDVGDVMIDVFVNAPQHLRLNASTRFWNASGFSIQLGAGGASLNVESLISLLQGGIAFDTIGSDLAPVDAGHVYELYPSESAARQNLIANVPGARLMLTAYFQGSVRGLEPGASVEYRGIPVGEVTAIQAATYQSEGQPRLSLKTTLSIVPGRLGIAEAEDEVMIGEALDLVEREVVEGLRAQLASSGLLAQSLHVDLAELQNPPPGALNRTAEPHPIIPTAPSDVSGVASSAEGLLKRITALPLEQVVESAVTLLANVNAIVTDESVRAAPENLGLLLADARRLLNEPGIQEAPAELARILASVRTLVDQATEAQLVANLDDVLTEAKAAVASIGTAADGVPELIDEIQTLSQRARNLNLDQLVAAGTRLVDNIDAFVQTQGVANLPGSLNSSLAELRALIADLRTGGAVDNVNATLVSVRQLSDDLAKAQLIESLQTTVQEARLAIGNVSTAAEGVPQLLTEIEALSAKARALPLDQVVASANGVLAKVDAFVASEGIGNLPGRLDASLTDLRALVGDLLTGGAVENVNASLASVRQITDELAKAQLAQSLDTVVQEARMAAGNISAASKDLPALIDSLTTLSTRTYELPLEDFVASGTRALDAADSFIASQGVNDVPPKLAAALEELRAILAELREGGAVTNVNNTLASADRAADAVTAAAAELPALVARLNAVASRADATLASVGPNSDINRDTLLLLREIRDTARSVNALVSALERRPNSVLFGR